MQKIYKYRAKIEYSYSMCTHTVLLYIQAYTVLYTYVRMYVCTVLHTDIYNVVHVKCYVHADPIQCMVILVLT